MNLNKVQNYNQKPYSKEHHPSFGNAGTVASEFLRFLNTNQAIGASLVDFCSMSAPRTIVDSQRGLDACIETGIRENSGTVNHIAIGAIGAMAAFALGQKINNEYNIRSHGVFANNDTIDILGRFWHENYPANKNDLPGLQRKFFEKVLENLQCRGKKIESATQLKIVDSMLEVAKAETLKNNKIPKDTLQYISNLVAASTGAENDLTLTFKNNSNITKEVKGLNSKAFFEDLIALGRTFSKEKVMNSFAEAVRFEDNAFIKNLKGVKMRSAILALSISSAIGASVQPFNRWLTKKRTGQDGFVGVTNNPNVDKGKKPSSGFFAAKVAAAAGMLGLAFTSITKNPKEFFSKIQFKGKIPTLAHYKLIYGITVASRFLAARDKNELRESLFKDILGFANWLILGGIVSKSIAVAADKKHSGLINNNAAENSGFFKKVLKSSVKTVDEVLLQDLKEMGCEVVENGKAIPYKKLLEKAKSLNMDKTMTKIKWLNIAQVGGYIYSALVLGYLLPKANIAMTNYFNKKQETQIPPDVKAAAATAGDKVVNEPEVFSEFIK